MMVELWRRWFGISQIPGLICDLLLEDSCVTSCRTIVSQSRSQLVTWINDKTTSCVSTAGLLFLFVLASEVLNWSITVSSNTFSWWRLAILKESLTWNCLPLISWGGAWFCLVFKQDVLMIQQLLMQKWYSDLLLAGPACCSIASFQQGSSVVCKRCVYNLSLDRNQDGNFWFPLWDLN